MKAVKRLSAGIALMFVFGVTGLAGETSAPPCPDPGETSAPPCSAAQPTDVSTDPGETSTPPSSASVDLVTIGEIALDMLTFF